MSFSSFIGIHQFFPYPFYCFFMCSSADKMGKLRIQWVIIILNPYTVIDKYVKIMGSHVSIEHP